MERKYYYNKETNEIIKEGTIEFKALEYLIGINNNLKNDKEIARLKQKNLYMIENYQKLFKKYIDFKIKKILDKNK